MTSLLPALASKQEYAGLPFDRMEAWLPGVQEILRAHRLSATAIEPFADGENPVFDLDGRWVLKLVPFFAAESARREGKALSWLAGKSTLPIPELIGAGELEGWSYLLSTRLPGIPLSRRWPSLDTAAQKAIARDLGASLAELHAVPLGGDVAGGETGASWRARRTAVWPARRDVARLSPILRESALAYLESVQLGQIDRSPVLLHGDLAPENVLVADRDGACRISGIFDFGNAFGGDAPFDFTAPTVLMAPGDRTIVRCFLEGYGWQSSTLEQLRPQLMAYTLLHPMADLPDCLGLIPGLPEARSWDTVAEGFW